MNQIQASINSLANAAALISNLNGNELEASDLISINKSSNSSQMLKESNCDKREDSCDDDEDENDEDESDDDDDDDDQYDDNDDEENDDNNAQNRQKNLMEMPQLSEGSLIILFKSNRFDK